MRTNKQIWITTAYQLIAKEGFDRLTVEELSRQVGKNKSSFYHYFGDLDLLEHTLLSCHLEATRQFAEETKACTALIPDVLQLMITKKDDLFFHKQLRIYREKPTYKACFESSYQIFQSALFDKWIDYLGLSEQQFFGEALLNLASENFLLRITYSSFTYEWLTVYVKEFAEMIGKIQRK